MINFAAQRTQMVDTQIRPSDVTKLPIIDALLSVRREVFVPETATETAYVGDHIPLGGTRVMLDPRVFAKMLDALNIRPGDLVLDIGCASGYSSAVLARLAQAVIALEEDPALVKEAETNLVDEGVDTVAVVSGALREGAPQHAPFDVIVVEGAVERLPDAILSQLADGGRIACLFVEGALGVVRLGHKIEGNVTWRFAFNASAPVIEGFERQAGFKL